jgi:hypothetical protein
MIIFDTSALGLPQGAHTDLSTPIEGMHLDVNSSSMIGINHSEITNTSRL